jgi:iron only hydrogenase large subunit-like protein
MEYSLILFLRLRRPDQIYHVSVMPCYDKKLEASRPDFTTPLSLLATSSATTDQSLECRDVDCVLTTGEVQKMMDEKSIDLAVLALSPSPVQEGIEEEKFFPSLIKADGTSSGGYLFNTIKAVLDTLEPEELYRTKLVEKKVRSEDYIEYTLIASSIASTSTLQLDSTPSSSLVPTSTTTTTLLRAAKCYGFRNLQNVVRKIGRDANISVTRGAAGKLATSSNAAALATTRRNAALARRKKSGMVEVAGGEEKPFDYVEVMACPSGCVNGGGQIAPPKSALRRRIRRIGNDTRIDQEGMPDVSETMLEEDSEMADGAEEKPLTGKEWVNKVEEVYWTTSSSPDSSPVLQATSVIDLSRVDHSILPYILSSESMLIRTKMDQAVNGLLGGQIEGPVREARRRELLRTSYRAVEDGEVNGLAVKW